MNPVVADVPILPGQRWKTEVGKHAGQEIEVLRTNHHSAIVRVLPSPGAKSWNKGKSGQVWTLGRNLFGTMYRLVRESGGGSVHDAPLPPAASRSGMTIEEAVADTTPVEPETVTTIEVNGHYSGTIVPYEKICSSCAKVKVAEDYFYHASASKDGYGIYCKECSNAKRKLLYDNKKAAATTAERLAALREVMGSERVKAAVREGSRRKFEALTAEQKGEIIALWQAKNNPQEVQKAYGLNGPAYHMVLEEYRTAQGERATISRTESAVGKVYEFPLDIDSFADAMDQQEVTPGTPALASKSYTVTYTVMRPVEVTEVVEASYMTEAIRVVGARDGVQEVTSVVLNK